MATRQREKKEKREAAADKRPMAEARYIRIPSSKVEIVLDLVRGKSYTDAVAILSSTNKSACEPILKVLNSAAANAENNNNMPKDNLYVAECWAGKGPTLKRMMPRARGRADRIFKGTSHITVVLDESKEDSQKDRGSSRRKQVSTEKKEVTVKKSVKQTPQKKETAKPVAQKNTTSPKEIPDTQSERPLTDQPNNKKPLGTKKETDTPGKTTRVATAKKKETK